MMPSLKFGYAGPWFQNGFDVAKAATIVKPANPADPTPIGVEYAPGNPTLGRPDLYRVVTHQEFHQAAQRRDQRQQQGLPGGLVWQA